MYYHGIDAKTRRAIARAEQERAVAIKNFWANLFAFAAFKRAPRAIKA